MIEEEIAGEATGIHRQGKLRFFHKSQPDEPLTTEAAKGLFWAGERIEVPAAGAGSYVEVIRTLLGENAEAYETSSSAGDWTIKLTNREGLFVEQTNRYPGLGFGYLLFNWKRANR